MALLTPSIALNLRKADFADIRPTARNEAFSFYQTNPDVICETFHFPKIANYTSAHASQFPDILSCRVTTTRVPDIGTRTVRLKRDIEVYCKEIGNALHEITVISNPIAGLITPDYVLYQYPSNWYPEDDGTDVTQFPLGASVPTLGTWGTVQPYSDCAGTGFSFSIEGIPLVMAASVGILCTKSGLAFKISALTPTPYIFTHNTSVTGWFIE